MAPKKNSVRVSFGAPVDEIPGTHRPSGYQGAAHWNKVAAHVKNSPGAWHPVTIGSLSIDRHKAAVGSINGTHAKRIYAFREDGFKAAFRDNQLYVRYDEPNAGLKVVEHKAAS